MSANDFTGLVAVVTGGASGIGLATALELTDRGAQVAVLDLNPDVPAPLAGFPADVADRASVDAAVAAVPGHTQFTRTPSRTWSVAIARVSASTAPFDAE